MDSVAAEALVKTWHGYTQRGKPDDHERSDQMRKLLVELAPGATHGIVIPTTGSQPPKGASWLSHEIVVLGEGCIYRFAGMEGVPEGFNEEIFSVAVVRVPLEQFKRVQVTDTRLPERQATSWKRRWNFYGDAPEPGLSISVECWEETGWKSQDAAFVDRLVQALGWPIEQVPDSAT